MPSLADGIYDLGRLDELASHDTPVHRIDPRAKVLTTAVFLLCVVSLGKYEVGRLLPFALFPVLTIAHGELPAGFLARKVVAVAPFALFVGILNPLLDRATVAEVAGIAVSGGWVSFASILLRFALTTTAALTLVATTGMTGVCAALGRLGVPHVLVTQTLLLYRYLFVLGEEAMRMARARSLRSVGSRGMGVRVYASMLGHLLLRTYARASRVYQAMLARGFDGRIRLTRTLTFTARDAAYVLGWSAAFVLFRVYNVPVLLGQALTELIA